MVKGNRVRRDDNRRVEVRLATKQRAVPEGIDEWLANGNPTPLLLAHEAPNVCVQHGEPEVERKPCPVLSKDLDPANRLKWSKIFSHAYRLYEPLGDAITPCVLRAHWPVCTECVVEIGRRRLAARAAWSVVAALILTIVVSVVIGGWMALVGAIAAASAGMAILIALKAAHRSRFFIRATLTPSGSAVVIPNAHPTFARLVEVS